MVHVIHDEAERRKHSRSFHISLRNGTSGSRSLSSSYSSASGLLASMCSSIADPSIEEVLRRWADCEEVNGGETEMRRSRSEEALAKSLSGLLPNMSLDESFRSAPHRGYSCGNDDANTTPATRRPISPRSGGHSRHKTMPTHPSTAQMKVGIGSFSVPTKVYDGTNLSASPRANQPRSPRSHKTGQAIHRTSRGDHDRSPKDIDSRSSRENIHVRDFPPLPFPGAESSSSGSRANILEKAQRRSLRRQKHAEAHRYQLGEKLRSRHHVLDSRDNEGLTHMNLVSELQSGDHAFIKRTDRSFSYATVIRNYRDPASSEQTLEFLVNSSHCTKIIPQRQWKSCIRIENEERFSPSGIEQAARDASPRCVKERVDQSLLHWA